MREIFLIFTLRTASTYVAWRRYLHDFPRSHPQKIHLSSSSSYDTFFPLGFDVVARFLSYDSWFWQLERCIFFLLHFLWFLDNLNVDDFDQRLNKIDKNHVNARLSCTWLDSFRRKVVKVSKYFLGFQRCQNIKLSLEHVGSEVWMWEVFYHFDD